METFRRAVTTLEKPTRMDFLEIAACLMVALMPLVLLMIAVHSMDRQDSRNKPDAFELNSH